MDHHPRVTVMTLWNWSLSVGGRRESHMLSGFTEFFTGLQWVNKAEGNGDEDK